MLKDASYTQRFAMLQEWYPYIIESIKKDLKNEHLRQNPAFLQQNFEIKNLNKIGTAALVKAYGTALQIDEHLGEYISARWLLKHTHIYNFFETELQRVVPNFTEIEELPPEFVGQLIPKALEQFGAIPTYLFVVINSVVLDADSLKQLEAEATAENLRLKQSEQEAVQAEQEKTTVRNLELELARSKDKYEKRLAGLERKYIQDVDSLKKEIARLQRKLTEKASAPL